MTKVNLVFCAYIVHIHKDLRPVELIKVHVPLMFRNSWWKVFVKVKGQLLWQINTIFNGDFLTDRPKELCSPKIICVFENSEVYKIKYTKCIKENVSYLFEL
jgi:hypothetical protein